MTIENEILQTKPFHTLQEKIFVNLIYTNNQVVEKFTKVLKLHDLTLPQYNVLRILKGQNQKPITIHGINSRMLDKMSNSSRLVDKLELKGMVQKSTKHDNLKALDIIITTKGLDAVALLSQEFAKLEIAKKFKEKDFDNLNKLLDKMRL